MQLVHWHSMSLRAFGIAFKTSKWYRWKDSQQYADMMQETSEERQ
jgi:hypothetical protein